MAATPFPERAAVLRRAADSLQRHTDELRNWIVRETGGIPGKAYFELGHAVQSCYEAAALPSRSQGELLPSAAPRLSMVRRVPAGGVSASGTGSRFGGAAANIEAFTETRWITARGDIDPYPF